LLADIEQLQLPENAASLIARMSSNASIPQSFLRNLQANQLREYYLLDPLPNSHEYLVVLMREIRHMDTRTARIISNGLNTLTNQKELERNNISHNAVDDVVFYHACLNSPYMEHMMQHFYSNYGRIGVEDHISTFPTDATGQLFN